MGSKKPLNPDELVWVNSDSRSSQRPNPDLQGIKQDEGKLVYDIDWEFIEQMAKRQDNSTYPVDNWKKPLPPKKLKDAITRHFIEIAKGNLEDDGYEFGHLIALACDAMMLHYQLKNIK